MIMSNTELINFIESKKPHVRMLRIYLHQDILDIELESKINSHYDFLMMLENATKNFLDCWELVYSKEGNIIFFTKKKNH